MPRLPLALLIALLPAACTAPAVPGCDSATLRELRTLDRLIAETNADIARGYRTEESTARSGFNLCLGSSRSNVGVSFCTDGSNRTRTVAVDPAAEARKLAALQDRRAALLAAHPACGAPK